MNLYLKLQDQVLRGVTKATKGQFKLMMKLSQSFVGKLVRLVAVNHWQVKVLLPHTYIQKGLKNIGGFVSVGKQTTNHKWIAFSIFFTGTGLWEKKLSNS